MVGLGLGRGLYMLAWGLICKLSYNNLALDVGVLKGLWSWLWLELDLGLFHEVVSAFYRRQHAFHSEEGCEVGGVRLCVRVCDRQTDGQRYSEVGGVGGDDDE